MSLSGLAEAAAALETNSPFNGSQPTVEAAAPVFPLSQAKDNGSGVVSIDELLVRRDPPAASSVAGAASTGDENPYGIDLPAFSFALLSAVSSDLLAHL